MKEQLLIADKDLLSSDEFNTTKPRSVLMPWWYHTAASIVTLVLLLILGQAIYVSLDPVRFRVMLQDKQLLYPLIAFAILSIWLVTGIITGWLRMRFALVHIYVPAALLMMAFIYFGIYDMKNMNWKGSAFVFLIVALFMIITVRAFVIRHAWKYSSKRKPVLR